MDHFIDWRESAGVNTEKFYKTTLWQGEHVMVGLNCLEANQTQSVHAHQGADKIYLVLEGHGRFSIGAEERDAQARHVGSGACRCSSWRHERKR
jgi:quercetin dioxygenase-like cupin family protein